MIVHRLDYATSGVIVFARNHDALKDLHKQFRLKNKIYKRYSAVVDGCINYPEGEIDLPLGKDPIRGPPLCRVDPENGKESHTLWKLHERGNGLSHVHLRPLTGRYDYVRCSVFKPNNYCSFK
jgi:tRNA pseudouridine32 synthase/23S rRNA pseudouridine746 synthase